MLCFTAGTELRFDETELRKTETGLRIPKTELPRGNWTTFWQNRATQNGNLDYLRNLPRYIHLSSKKRRL